MSERHRTRLISDEWLNQPHLAAISHGTVDVLLDDK